MTDQQAQRAQRAASISLASTVVVVIIKLVAAFYSHSISVLAEGLQSTVDILMSLVALITLRIAAKPADKTHPYGHGKAELLSSALQMMVILASGVYVLWIAYARWIDPKPIESNWGVLAMAYAVISNLIVTRYLTRAARECGSAALASEAQHLRGDTLASTGVLVGVALVGFTGVLRFDSGTAALFMVIAMAQAALHLRGVIHPLMDGALPKDEVEVLETVLNSHPQVRGYHNLRTRFVGSHRFIDLHVLLDDQLTFVMAHDIAEHIESEIRDALGGGVVSIHYEPYEAELAHRAKEH